MGNMVALGDAQVIGGFEALGMSSQGVLPVLAGGGAAGALTVAGRLVAKPGSALHRHAPAVAGVAAAAIIGLATKSWAGVITGLMVGGGIWVAERMLEFQAARL